MSSDLYPQLSEPFPAEMVRTVRKSGTTLDYIPVSEVITRLNKVLGVENWSFEVVNVNRDPHNPEFVVAHVRITAMLPSEQQIRRDGVGGQKINKTKAGEIIDLGDDFKGAVSDALKKAATTLGVALYLSRTDDAIETEQAIDNSPPPVPVTPEVNSAWTNFLAQSRLLDADGRKAMGEFWTNYAPGRDKPTRETVSLEDVEALLAEALTLTVGGSLVDAA